MILPTELELYFDGACEPVNPGGVASYGWRLVEPDGSEIDAGCGEVCRGPGATNNVAEWAALLQGLSYLQRKGWYGRLEILGDSQLVIKQLNEQWQCNKENLRAYREKCWAILACMKSWEARWIPREENAETDRLSKWGS